MKITEINDGARGKTGDPDRMTLHKRVRDRDAAQIGEFRVVANYQPPWVITTPGWMSLLLVIHFGFPSRPAGPPGAKGLHSLNPTNG